MAVSDVMVEAARKSLDADGWISGDAPSYEGDVIRRALEAADAVRGDAAPAGTVAVRVAVAMDKDGTEWLAGGGNPVSSEECMAQLVNGSGLYPSCIATIHAPLPAVAEVGAVVEGV